MLDREGSRDITLKYGQMIIYIPPEQLDTNYRRKAEPTINLYHSGAAKDIAEFQWRLSTPISTLLLAMLAVPLSRSAPRQGRHNSFLLAIGVYIGLFNLISVARNSVEEGSIPAFPGIWWSYIPPVLLFIILMAWPAWQRWRRTR
jgi:lipopolysaccharide export system permease protein